MHTDGLAEAENLAGESFGERQLEKVVREHHSLSAQDDITLIVMDVL